MWMGESYDLYDVIFSLVNLKIYTVTLIFI